MMDHINAMTVMIAVLPVVEIQTQIASVVPQDIYHIINAFYYALMEHLRMMDRTYAMNVIIAALPVMEIQTQIA